MSQKIKTSVEIDGSLTASQIANATTDTDKFLVSDGGTVKYRTGAELASDLGIASGSTSKVQHQVKAGVAINKGQAVYVTSADGTNMIVGLASNASEATSSKTMGLLNATVVANGFADVITEGLLDGLNTSAATVGDPVWLGTGGNLIYGLANKPYAPNHLVFIGIVTRVNANNGEIFVKVQNGFELDEIHDVDLKTTAKINGHLLGYNGSLWVNKTIAEWLGYTPYNASNPAGYISSYTETDTLASVTARGATTTSDIFTPNNGGIFFNGGGVYGSGVFGRNAGQDLGFNAGGTQKAYLNASGDFTANNSLRSPIFYDSDNTAYYVNPASATRLNGYLSFGVPGNGANANGRWLSIEGNTDVDGEGSGRIFFTEHNSTTAAMDAYGLSIGYRGGATSLTTAGGNTWTGLSAIDNGSWGFWGHNGDTTGTLAMFGPRTGEYITATGSFRAPIFYDSNNTTYYLDPASTSNLLGLTVTNTITGNISGNAATASNLSGGINLSTSGISSMKVNDTRYWVTDPNAPGNYFQALTMGNGSDFTQIGVNSSQEMYFRFNGSGNIWNTVLSSNNYSAFAVPLSRTITINGTSYDLSANRSWTVTASETDTLATVTGRGNSTSSPISVNSVTTTASTQANATLGTIASSWGGISYPTLYGSATDRWVMHINPHISYTQNGVNGFTGSMVGSTVRMASDTIATHYWDIGVGTNNVGIDRFSIGRNATNFLSINNSGNVISSIDMRSPIFYDSNDTAYYGDFASTSNFRNLLLNNQTTINTTTPGLTSYGLTFMGGNSDQANGMTWTWGNTNAQAGIYVQSSGAYGTKMYFATTDSFATGAKTAMAIDHSGNVSLNRGTFSNGSVWINNGVNYNSYNENIRLFNATNGVSVIAFGASGTSGTPQSSILGFSDRLEIRVGSNGTAVQRNYDNYVEAMGSSRAPIFYDSNNTGYYVDPASTSNLNGLTVAGTISGNVSGTARKINIGSAQTITDLNISVGDAGSVMFDTFQSGALNKPVSGNNANGVLTFSMAHGPQYGKQIAFADDDDLYIRRLSANGYASWRKILHSGNYTSFNYFDMPYGGNEISGMGPITNWDSRPGVGMAGFGINWHTGVSISGYGGYGGVRLYASGYPTHSGSVLRLEASDSVKTYGTFTNDSSVRSPIFYDSNDTAYYLDPASTSSLNVLSMANKIIVGSFPNATVNNGEAWIGRAVDRSAGTMTVQLGGNLDRKFEVVDYGWTTVNFSVNGYGAAEASGSMRAPIFYDSNNTGYYVDPSSTSVIDGLAVAGNITARSNTTSGASGGILNLGGTSSDPSGIGNSGIIGITWGSRSDSQPYYMVKSTYQTYGGYSFNRLDLSWHTGIIMGAATSYGGVRIYDNSLNVASTVLFSVGNGDSNVRAANDIIAYASDRRLKHNIQPIENALSKVNSLTGMTYQWNEVGSKHGWNPDTEIREAGVFAQDVQAVLPEAVRLAPFDEEMGVSKSGENFLTVKYDKIVPLLIEAIKEQQTQIEELKELVNKLINK